MAVNIAAGGCRKPQTVPNIPGSGALQTPCAHKAGHNPIAQALVVCDNLPVDALAKSFPGSEDDRPTPESPAMLKATTVTTKAKPFVLGPLR